MKLPYWFFMKLHEGRFVDSFVTGSILQCVVTTHTPHPSLCVLSKYRTAQISTYHTFIVLLFYVHVHLPGQHLVHTLAGGGEEQWCRCWDPRWWPGWRCWGHCIHLGLLPMLATVRLLGAGCWRADGRGGGHAAPSHHSDVGPEVDTGCWNKFYLYHYLYCPEVVLGLSPVHLNA